MLEAVTEKAKSFYNTTICTSLDTDRNRHTRIKPGHCGVTWVECLLPDEASDASNRRTLGLRFTWKPADTYWLPADREREKLMEAFFHGLPEDDDPWDTYGGAAFDEAQVQSYLWNTTRGGSIVQDVGEQKNRIPDDGLSLGRGANPTCTAPAGGNAWVRKSVHEDGSSMLISSAPPFKQVIVELTTKAIASETLFRKCVAEQTRLQKSRDREDVERPGEPTQLGSNRSCSSDASSVIVRADVPAAVSEGPMIAGQHEIRAGDHHGNPDDSSTISGPDGDTMVMTPVDSKEENDHGVHDERTANPWS